jgi:hypothetical protein
MLDASTYIASYGSVFGNLATFFVLLLPEDATPRRAWSARRRTRRTPTT